MDPRYPALLAEVGPERLAALRAPQMGRATAEVTLQALIGALDEAAPAAGQVAAAPAARVSGRERLWPRRRPGRPTVGVMPVVAPPGVGVDEDTDDSIEIAPFAGFAAYEIAVEGDPFAGANDAIDVIDGMDGIDASEPGAPAEISLDAALDRGDAASALLRPPSRPVAPAPPPSTVTRAAMDALFEGEDASGAGLVLFGDGMDGELDGGAGFAPQPGTDPDMAPLPADAVEGEPTEEGDTSRPGPVAAEDPVLAGAEAPVGEGEPAFGFGFGDDEPTVAGPRPLAVEEEAVDRRGARRDETLLSSVRKLFGFTR